MDAPGYRKCEFRCPIEAEERARLVLMRFNCVEPGSVVYKSGAVHWLIDLASVNTGDGPAVELMLQRELERHTQGAP